MAALENELIDLNFTIGQLQKKHATILAFSKRYPQSYFTEGHQIINLKEDGYRYLSPAVQAMGIKVRMISDLTPVPHNGCRPPKKRRV